MTEVNPVTMNVKKGAELKSYTFLDKEVAEGAKSIFTYKGKNYVKVKIKEGDKEVYKYMLPSEGEAAVVETEQKTEKPASDYDRTVDGFFDAIDKSIGIDNTKATSDGNNNGKISWGEKAARFFKGAVLTPIKSIVKHPIISIGAAIGVGLAVAAAPIVGTVLATAGLAIGGATALYGGYKAWTAKTDSEARNAWENIGSGLVTAILSGKALSKLAPKDGVTRGKLEEICNTIKCSKDNSTTVNIKNNINNMDNKVSGLFGKIYRYLIWNKQNPTSTPITKDFIIKHLDKANQLAINSLSKGTLALKTTRNFPAAKNAINHAKSIISTITKAGVKPSDDLVTALTDLEQLYASCKLSAKVKAGAAYAWAGLLGNAADNSATVAQKVYDTAPAFVN